MGFVISKNHPEFRENSLKCPALRLGERYTIGSADGRFQRFQKPDRVLQYPPARFRLALTGSKQKEVKDKLDAGQKSVSVSGDSILNGLKEQAAPAGLGKVKLPKFKF